MANGIFLINYSGTAGFGSAALVFHQGQIFGVDVAGSNYTGTYSEAGNQINGRIDLQVQAGSTLVTGAPVSNQAYTVPIPFVLPSGITENQTVQIQVHLPSGPVNANVRKVKNFAA